MAERPVAWVALVFAAGGLAAIITGLRSGAEARTFWGGCVFIAGLLGSAAASLFPVILYSTVSGVFDHGVQRIFGREQFAGSKLLVARRIGAEPRLRLVRGEASMRAGCTIGKMPLTDKVVLITGANGGLGTAVTNAFLDAGARVAGIAKKIQNSDFPHPNFIAYLGGTWERRGCTCRSRGGDREMGKDRRAGALGGRVRRRQVRCRHRRSDVWIRCSR